MFAKNVANALKMGGTYPDAAGRTAKRSLTWLVRELDTGARLWRRSLNHDECYSTES